jgi:hypothetical protein
MQVLSSGVSARADYAQSLRWLVTNGETTVGPVHTELLLRGYMGGRIPEHCQVRELSWSLFRPLDHVREIVSLKRRLAQDHERPLNLRDAVSRLPDVREEGELLALALQLAVQTVDAHAGVVHRYRQPALTPVASAVVGVMPECLGEALPASDPSYQLALRGRTLCGSPHQGLAERLVAERLQHDGPLSSVVMAPVIARGKLVALIELGRTGHRFRADDAAELAELAAHVASRLG